MSDRPIKRLVNYSEEKVFRELSAVSEANGLNAYPKVRVADVLSIDGSGIDDDLYSYALKAHFDFIVAGDDHIPEFAVEFDGPGHGKPEQKARDEKKNALCKRFSFPLLRINLNHVSRKYRDLTLLAWIVDVYQLQIAFDDAQTKGHVPYDEPFDPSFIVTSRTPDKRFPYWISLDANAAVHRLHREGKIKYPGTCGFIGYDKADVMQGIEFVEVTYSEGLMVTSAMRSQDFPLHLSDLFSQILAILLYEKLQEYLKGNQPLMPLSEIFSTAEQYQATLQMAHAHATGRSVEPGELRNRR